MKKIKLTQGKFALVDNTDYNKVSKYKWCCSKQGHTFFAERRLNNLLVRMHRFILKLKRGDRKEIDHINHNGLDNRRSNLRVCTRSQNLWNLRLLRRTKTQVKGVHLFRNKKFQYRITYYGKEVHGGYTEKLADAIRYRNCMARILHGKFATIIK